MLCRRGTAGRFPLPAHLWVTHLHNLCKPPVKYPIALRYFLPLTLIILLSGCTIPTLIAQTTLDSEIGTSERGHLVGTIGSTELPGYGWYQVYFHSKDKKIRGYIVLNASRAATDRASQLDWNVPNWKGIAFDVPLPPGEYEFSGMHLGQSQSPYQLTSNFSVPFRIDRNESLYVGEIKCHPSLVPRFAKSDRYVPSGGFFSITDESARDVPVIRMKFRELEQLPMRIQVPASTYLGGDPPLFRTFLIATSAWRR